MVVQRQFTASHTHFWWPRRKDEGAARDEQLALHTNDSSRQGLNQLNYSQVPKKIHILGAGNLGCFVAHSLVGIPNRPPVTLLLLRRQRRQWEEHGKSIDLISRGMTQKRQGFEVEYPQRPRGYTSEPEEMYTEGDVGSSVQAESAGFIDREGNLGSQKHMNGANSQVNDNDRMFDRLQVQDTTSDPSIASNFLGSSSREIHADTLSPLEDRKSAPREGSAMKEWFGQDRSTPQELETRDSRQLEEGGDSTSYYIDEEIIYNLIVSVKAPRTIKAIQAVAHRLVPESTILLLQNGMGIIDELNEKLFPDEEHRPTYIIGVVSHGLYTMSPFSVNHAGEGTIALGVMPHMPIQGTLKKDSISSLAPSARYLIRTITRTPVFVAVGFPPTDLLQQQLDKLAVNCIINPLTAILECKNGELLSSFHFTRVIRLLLAEISLVIKSLPEMENVPNVKMRFDTLRLERLTFSIARMTSQNNSSMLQDVKAGRQTEIDYINGYIIKRGEEMGIHCVMNYMLMHMIKGKRKIGQADRETSLPFAGGRRR